MSSAFDIKGDQLDNSLKGSPDNYSVPKPISIDKFGFKSQLAKTRTELNQYIIENQIPVFGYPVIEFNGGFENLEMLDEQFWNKIYEDTLARGKGKKSLVANCLEELQKEKDNEKLLF